MFELLSFQFIIFMKEKIILIGGGGHCKFCIDVIEQSGICKIAGIVDLPEKLHQKILGYEIIATDDDLPRLINEYKNFLITLGQIKSPEKRIRIFSNTERIRGKITGNYFTSGLCVKTCRNWRRDNNNAPCPD